MIGERTAIRMPLVVQIVAWIVGLLLAYGAVRVDVTALDVKQQGTQKQVDSLEQRVDKRLERIETKIDSLMERKR